MRTTTTGLPTLPTLVLAMLAAAAIPGQARASCGATFCSVNTNWDVQGQWTEPGIRFDLRYEYIDQDQPRAGTRKVEVGALHRHHDEVATLNRNLRATADLSFDGDWGVAVSAPVVDRRHTHIHHHHGEDLVERWSFRELGDVTVVGRYQLAGGAASGYGLRFGLKLPTGKTDLRNAEGDLAERTLQPGTGTTDGILGAFYQAQGARIGWFAQATYTAPFNEDDGYAPGDELAVDVGMAYPFGQHLVGLVQVNASTKGRDSGANAEPEDSGGEFVFLSPGLSYQLFHNLQLYTFVQLPLYQRVNGIQLTADRAGIIGLSTRF